MESGQYRCARCGEWTIYPSFIEYMPQYGSIYDGERYKICVCNDCMDDELDPRYKVSLVKT